MFALSISLIRISDCCSPELDDKESYPLSLTIFSLNIYFGSYLVYSGIYGLSNLFNIDEDRLIVGLMVELGTCSCCLTAESFRILLKADDERLIDELSGFSGLYTWTKINGLS